MNPISHKARTRRHGFSVPGCMVLKDEDGRTGFTRLHDKGHLTARAAHANVLSHAARSRHLPADHAIYMQRAKDLRKRGTWL